MAVASAIDAGRDRGRMVVAGLLRHLAVHQPARGLEVEHEELRLQQRRLDPLAAPRLLALDDGDGDAVRAEDAGAKVGDRDADAHRALAGQSGDRHQPAHALRDLVESRPQAVRPVLAVAGDAGVDEARVDRGHRLVVDAELSLHVGTEVLDQHVGLQHQLLEDRDALGRLQVQRHAALVAVDVAEVAAFARAADAFAFVHRRRHLDLDDLRAPVGELADRRRAGANAGEVEDGEVRERRGGSHEISLA